MRVCVCLMGVLRVSVMCAYMHASFRYCASSVTPLALAAADASEAPCAHEVSLHLPPPTREIPRRIPQRPDRASGTTSVASLARDSDEMDPETEKVYKLERSQTAPSASAAGGAAQGSAADAPAAEDDDDDCAIM